MTPVLSHDRVAVSQVRQGACSSSILLYPTGAGRLSQVLIQHTYRPSFPNIWMGREADFDKASILAVRGEKHRSLRGAWTPMFFSGRRAACSKHIYHEHCLHKSLLLWRLLHMHHVCALISACWWISVTCSLRMEGAGVLACILRASTHAMV